MSSHCSIVSVFLAAGLLVALASRPAGANGSFGSFGMMNEAGEGADAPKPSLVKRIRVLEENGQPLSGGEVEIFKSEVFVTRSKIGSDGYIELDHSKLTSGESYRVGVLDANLDEIYAMDEWAYNASDFDVGFDPATGLDKYDLTIALQGAKDRALSLAVDRRIDETWREAVAPAEAAALEEDGALFPKYVATASVVFMFGNFGADDEALGVGIPEADPGFALTFGFRHGYPTLTDANTWAKYREFTLAYAQNRYTTNQAYQAGQSDVAYHRGTVAYGIGRLKGKQDMSVALAIDVGGIYDGSEKLEFGDREYGLFGVGVRGRYILRLASHLGLSGDVDLMYYPADSQDNDHWYGLAPSIAIGAAVY